MTTIPLRRRGLLYPRALMAYRATAERFNFAASAINLKWSLTRFSRFGLLFRVFQPKTRTRFAGKPRK
jgi:hypothetical protein